MWWEGVSLFAKAKDGGSAAEDAILVRSVAFCTRSDVEKGEGRGEVVMRNSGMQAGGYPNRVQGEGFAAVFR